MCANADKRQRDFCRWCKSGNHLGSIKVDARSPINCHFLNISVPVHRTDGATNTCFPMAALTVHELQHTFTTQHSKLHQFSSCAFGQATNDNTSADNTSAVAISEIKRKQSPPLTLLFHQLPLEVGPPPIAANGSAEALKLPDWFRARPPNAFGLLKTLLLTTSLM